MYNWFVQILNCFQLKFNMLPYYTKCNKMSLKVPNNNILPSPRFDLKTPGLLKARCTVSAQIKRRPCIKTWEFMAAHNSSF